MSLQNRIMPFFVAILIMIFMVFGFILLAYIILFAVIFGTVAYLYDRVKTRFLKAKAQKTKPASGRIIDSDDWRKL